MKKLIPILIGALSALGAERSIAANYQGYVTSVYPYNTLVYVVISNGAFDGGSSTCRSATDMVYSFDPSTAIGRAIMAVALTAKVSGVLVYAAGTSSCTTGSPFGGGSEGLRGMDLKGS